jgi:hypothetical protein
MFNLYINVTNILLKKFNINVILDSKTSKAKH